MVCIRISTPTTHRFMVSVGLASLMSSCVRDVASWMQFNRLQLNTSSVARRRQHLIPDTPLIVGVDAVLPAHSVRHLGIYIDSDVSIRIHVVKTASSCFCALRQIRSILRTVSKHVLLSLVVAVVLARLDYGSATLAGLPDMLLGKLQSVLNAAARLVFSGRKYDHVTPLLRDLHWLPFPERIMFRLAVLVYRCLHGLAPSYLSAYLHRFVYADSRRQRCSFHARDSRQLVTELSQLLLHALGTIYQPVYFQEETQNQICFSRFFVLTVYMRAHVLFYMPFIYRPGRDVKLHPHFHCHW